MLPTPSSEELAAWLRLSLEPGLGAAQARHLLHEAGLPQNIYAMSSTARARLLPQELARQMVAEPAPDTLDIITRTLRWLDAPAHHIVTLADPAYPKTLLDTHDPPLLLYVNGRIDLLDSPIIAMVGARNASQGGVDNALAFAHYLAEHGWCIASGLALGIDAAAHRGALRAGPRGGGTIAVLGTGIDMVYPAKNRDLAHQIALHGALVSEFPLGARAMPYQFPKRNRVVAGLARGVLVVEAATQSGSLITAKFAAEMGREVFAIPGSIHSPLSRGCHALIRQGAKLVESGADIHDELGLAHPGVAINARFGGKAGSAQPQAAHADSRRVLDALGYDPVDIDTLQRRTQFSPAALNTCLLELELNEFIIRADDGRFQRR
ncbi:MAG: DNA-protecting protein DprA [Candidimonas sp.]|nr:MAG: DNA-protecting protein DprA [Candidimonas sp.]TAM25252.1 MAG: DNA-protecting protein DprA [Candidimonas sp.]TAM76759.1 MAG: DNA-protecting protein DprA [Candidimonas sp.]